MDGTVVPLAYPHRLPEPCLGFIVMVQFQLEDAFEQQDPTQSLSWIMLLKDLGGIIEDTFTFGKLPPFQVIKNRLGGEQITAGCLVKRQEPGPGNGCYPPPYLVTFVKPAKQMQTDGLKHPRLDPQTAESSRTRHQCFGQGNRFLQISCKQLDLGKPAAALHPYSSSCFGMGKNLLQALPGPPNITAIKMRLTDEQAKLHGPVNNP